MALHVNYKNRLGYFKKQSLDGRWRKVWFCRANALCSMMYFYREEKDGKRHDMVQLWGFFADVTHAERCINTGYFKNCGRFVFYAKALNKDLWKMIQLMTENGIKVTIK